MWCEGVWTANFLHKQIGLYLHFKKTHHLVGKQCKRIKGTNLHWDYVIPEEQLAVCYQSTWTTAKRKKLVPLDFLTHKKIIIANF